MESKLSQPLFRTRSFPDFTLNHISFSYLKFYLVEEEIFKTSMRVTSNMKILIVFFSMTGRTRQVAQAIAAELRTAEVQVEEIKYNGGSTSKLGREQAAVVKGDMSHFTFKQDILDLAPYDRVFFGTPTYGGSPAPTFRGFLENCKNVTGKEWVLFATCRFVGGKNLNTMRGVIEQKGGKVVAQQMFKGFFKINLQKAQAFGQSLNK